MKRIIAGLIASLIIATCLPASYAVAQEEEIQLTVCISPRGKMYFVPNARQEECKVNDRVTVWSAPIVLEKPAHLYDDNDQDLGVLVDTALFHDHSSGVYASNWFQNKYKTYVPELFALVTFGYERNMGVEDGLAQGGTSIKIGEKALILYTGANCTGDPFSVYLNPEIARTVYRNGQNRYFVSTGEPLANLTCLSSRDDTGTCGICPADPANISLLALPLIQVTMPFSNNIKLPLYPDSPTNHLLP